MILQIGEHKYLILSFSSCLKEVQAFYETEQRNFRIVQILKFQITLFSITVIVIYFNE